MARHVVITGVSTGIGRAAALALAQAGYNVFGSVRRAEDARAFEMELGGRGVALVFDVADEAAVRAAAEQVAQRTGTDGLAALINNAGAAFGGPLEHISLDRLRSILEINVVGLLATTQAFLPLLRAGRRPGKVINISSVSGRIAMPFAGAYAATKFAVEGLSDALRRELRVYGIDVVVVQPSSIATPMWSKAVGEDQAPYQGTPYATPLAEVARIADETGRAGLPAERVGALIARIVQSDRPKVRYVIARQPLQRRIMERMPTRLLDRLIARALSLRGPGKGDR